MSELDEIFGPPLPWEGVVVRPPPRVYPFRTDVPGGYILTTRELSPRHGFFYDTRLVVHGAKIARKRDNWSSHADRSHAVMVRDHWLLREKE